MNDNDNASNPSAHYNTFKVSLTREQQKALTTLLPRNLSFQPSKTTRSIDEESLKSEPKNHKKKIIAPPLKEQKDPDYSASYAPLPPPSSAKEVPSIKAENPGIPGGDAFVQCYCILKKLKKNIYSWPFRAPVDPKALKVPDYFNYIMEPMDLKTMEQNLKKGSYDHPAEFHRDMYKMMMNSYKFNQKSSDVYATTEQFEEEYLKLVKDAKEGKLNPPKNSCKIKQEDNMISESYLNIKEPPQMERALSSSHPQPSKPARQYQKKEKSQKTDTKGLQRQWVLEKEVQKVQIRRQPQGYQYHLNEVKHEEIDLFLSLQTMKEEHVAEVYEKQRAQPQKTLYQQKIENKQIEEPEYELSTQHLKRNKSKIIDRKHRQKRPKKGQALESPSQLKELKETTQAQSQKTVIYNQIQKRLTKLLKQLNEYQMPNKAKLKSSAKHSQGPEHPNFNNFTPITASEKKKLAEKIFALPAADLRYIIQICFRNKRTREQGVQEFEIDLDKLDSRVLKELFNFVSMRIKRVKKESGKHKEEVKLQENSVYEEQQPVEPEENEIQEQRSRQYNLEEEADNNNPESASYPDLLAHDVDHHYSHNNFAPEFDMIDSDDGRRRHPGDSFSNQFHF